MGISAAKCFKGHTDSIIKFFLLFIDSVVCVCVKGGHRATFRNLFPHSGSHVGSEDPTQVLRPGG